MSVVLIGSGRRSIADRFVMLRRVTASSAYSASLALSAPRRPEPAKTTDMRY